MPHTTQPKDLEHEETDDDAVDDEEEATCHLFITRGNFGESVKERDTQFWVCTSFADFGPYASLNGALGEPVDGPITALTDDVTEVSSDTLATEQIVKHLYVFDPEFPPQEIRINGQWFDIRGEEILPRANAPQARRRRQTHR